MKKEEMTYNIPVVFSHKDFPDKYPIVKLETTHNDSIFNYSIIMEQEVGNKLISTINKEIESKYFESLDDKQLNKMIKQLKDEKNRRKQ